MDVTLKAFLVGCLSLGCASLHAQSIASGTASFVSERNCVAGSSGCDSLTGLVESVLSSNSDGVASNSSLAASGYGTVSASSSLSGPLGAPILSVSAISTGGTREAATAVGLQSYTYIGTSSITDTFGGVLNYTQTINGNYSLTGSGISTNLAIFTLPPGAQFDAGLGQTANFASLLDASVGNLPLYSGGVVQPAFTLLGLSAKSDSATNFAGSLDPSGSVTLTPGETVWIAESLQAIAPNGSSVDPTFSAKWSNTTGLVIGPSAVRAPELDPNSAVSGATLLGGVILLLRGRRKPNIPS